jgi:hypothetical protein
VKKEYLENWLRNEVTQYIIAQLGETFDWRQATDIRTLGMCQGSENVINCLKNVVELYAEE